MPSFDGLFHVGDQAEEDYDKYLKVAGLSDGENRPVYFSLKNGESGVIYFISDPKRKMSPLVFWQHYMYDSEGKEGAGGHRVFTCLAAGSGVKADCPGCSAGDKPSLKNAWQVVEILPEEGGTRVKLYVIDAKFKIAKTIKTYLSRLDLSTTPIYIEKTGKGAHTVMPEATENLPGYTHEEVVDLEDYFGMDDKRFKDFERVAAELREKDKKTAPTGRMSELEETTDDIPF